MDGPKVIESEFKSKNDGIFLSENLDLFFAKCNRKPLKIDTLIEIKIIYLITLNFLQSSSQDIQFNLFLLNYLFKQFIANNFYIHYSLKKCLSTTFFRQFF